MQLSKLLLIDHLWTLRNHPVV